MLKYYGNVIDVVKPLRLLKNINEHRKHQRGIVPTFRMDKEKKHQKQNRTNGSLRGNG